MAPKTILTVIKVKTHPMIGVDPIILNTTKNPKANKTTCQKLYCLPYCIINHCAEVTATMQLARMIKEISANNRIKPIGNPMTVTKVMRMVIGNPIKNKSPHKNDFSVIV